MKELIKILSILFFLGVSLTVFSQEKVTLENGTKIVVFPNKTWIYENEYLETETAESNSSKIVVDLDDHKTIYPEPKSSDKTLWDFNRKGVEIIDYFSNYFMVKSVDGRIGYISSFFINNGETYEKTLIENKMSKAREEGKELLIRQIKVEEINSANGVDFSIDWLFLNQSKTIKYIYFTVEPYNLVGDIQKCSISDHSSFTGKVTGPIKSENKYNNSYWSTAWYNNTIGCLKLTKVKVEYIDGSKYTYVVELPKILDSDVNNSCK